MSPRFDLDHPEALPKYDAIVVGSDEVWNLRHPWFGEKPAFFGGGLPTDRLISYAASFGNFSSWEGIGSPWTDLLARVDHISVRDENSWWMLKNALGIEVPIVLDPALQWAIDPDGPWKGPSSPFALVYGHNFSEEFVNKIRDWSRRRNLPLLSIGYRNDWADDSWLDADPHDFAHAFARSQAVLTNFFHGCIFSLRNQRPFACEKSPYRSIKISGLMELLETESRLVSPSDPMDGLLDEPIPDATLDRIEALRRASTDYLAQALQFAYVC
jgi:hypothetical protein